MAADRLNKRSKVNSVICHTSWETWKAKKNKYSHYDLNTKSSISLEWDDKKEQVVPKKKQISIARSELTPFLPLVRIHQNVLGDVFAVPPELFELNNLTGVLSFEVWQTYLSTEEREFLTQFLPAGVDPHLIVYELLAGNNFSFGNPCRKWGASVCSDDCHPDSILRQEQCNKANKIAYYSELHEYHTKMIGTLQSWKEKWEIGVNPENVGLQKTPRPRNDANKSRPSHENGIQYGPGDYLVATSYSCSSDANNKSYTGDSPHLAITSGETSKRVSKTNSGNKHYDSSGGRSAARPKKEDKVHRLNIECGDDGAKYMSYIKISKEQHERVKSSMKHSYTSIQPKCLNHVLGNLESFCVQPYKVFEEEERQKLHDYWLHLAKKDVPAGFENWKSWQSAKWQLTKSLRKEMEDKWKSNDLPVMDLYNLDEQQVGETNGVLLNTPEEKLEKNGDSVFRSEADLTASNQQITDESSQDSDQNQHLPHITIHNNNTQNVCPIAINTNNDLYTENINHTDVSIDEQFAPLSSSSETWPPVSMSPGMYYNQPILLQSLLKHPGNSHYLHEQKLSWLGNDPILGTSQFPKNISSSLPLGPRHEIQENLLPSNHLQYWHGNGIGNLPMPASSHNLISQNWFSGDEVARDGWSGGVVPNQELGNSGQVADGSLFSVLSQFNGLRSGVNFGSTGQFIQPGDYIGVGRAPVPPTTAITVPPRAARGPGLNYTSGNDAQLGWMNLTGSEIVPKVME